MPTLHERISDSEMMDEPDVSPADLERTLYDLARLNRYFGVHDIIRRFLCPSLLRLPTGQLNILDVGTGLADCPVVILKFAARHGKDWKVTATDSSPLALDIAHGFANENIDDSMRGHLSFSMADLENLPYEEKSFDVVTASQVLHHFDDSQIPGIISRLSAIARHGVFIQDLHRHRIPLTFIAATSRALNLSPLVQNDGPISVRKGFTRKEIRGYFRDGKLDQPTVRWHPSFRWIISSLSVQDNG